MFWLVSCQLDINLNHQGGGNHDKEMPPSDWPVGRSVVHFLG